MESTLATEHPHVVRTPGVQGGEPVIRGTRVPVRSIVLMWRAGELPEEIAESLPTIGLAQVFDALSYYVDHREEIEALIRRHEIPEDLIDPIVRDA